MRNVFKQIFLCKGDKSYRCACLVCRVFSGKMDFLIQIATIMMGLSIICFKGLQGDFRNKYVLQSLQIAFIIANSGDPA